MSLRRSHTPTFPAELQEAVASHANARFVEPSTVSGGADGLVLTRLETHPSALAATRVLMPTSGWFRGVVDPFE
jgi:hypothetical protein